MDGRESASGLRVYRDDDADPAALDGERVAVIGYGIQGRAQALNLRDSGVDVVVGNRDDAHAAVARNDGFPVLEIAGAAAQAGVVSMLIPDEAQAEVFESSIREGLGPGDALVFAHGFALRFHTVEPPDDVDVLLLAPRMPGRHVRRRFLEGGGVPAYVDVARDASGRAWPRLLALARGIGATRAGAIRLDAATETELDLFSEQFTFPMIFRVLELAYEELVAQGYPPEVAVMELHGSGELGVILSEAARVGLYPMLRNDGSPACRFGLLRSRRDLLDPEEVRERAREVLAAVRDGSFARELTEDQRFGHPMLEEMEQRVAGLPLSKGERRLHALLAAPDAGAERDAGDEPVPGRDQGDGPVRGQDEGDGPVRGQDEDGGPVRGQDEDDGPAQGPDTGGDGKGSS